MSVYDKYAELLKEYNDLKQSFDLNSAQLEDVIGEKDYWKSQTSHWKEAYLNLGEELAGWE